MKWNHDEILKRGEELADRFDAFEPAKASDVPVGEYVLVRAIWQRARCEREVADAVNAALKDGISWTRIGEILGVSDREAEMQYSHLHWAKEPSRDREFGGPEL